MGYRWNSRPGHLELESCKNQVHWRLISSLDLACGSKDIMSEIVTDNVPVPGGHRSQ